MRYFVEIIENGLIIETAQFFTRTAADAFADDARAINAKVIVRIRRRHVSVM